MNLKKELLNKNFKVIDKGKYLKLRYGRGINTILINKNFKFDEDVASLAGLMPDGSLIKDLRRIYFHQKKDENKLYFFRKLIIKVFKPDNKVFIRKKGKNFDSYINSTTLAMFFYHILKIPRSDQQMRVPIWIFNSHNKVKSAYLKQAYSMEGTILKSLNEIRFITKDKKFAFDIKKLLSQLSIGSIVKKRIGGTHRTIQYRVSVYRKDNFRKFKEIGFTYKMHKVRFNNMIKKYNL